MADDIVKGSDVILKAKLSGVYYPIGCAISCSFAFKNELVGKTDVNAGLYKKYRVRSSDCTASINGVIKLRQADNVLSPFYFLQSGIRRAEVDYRFEFTAQDGGTKQLDMKAVVESLDLSGDVNDFAPFDLKLQGTGDITLSDIIAAPATIDAKNVYSDWWITTPSQTYISGASSVNSYSLVGKTIIEVDREGTSYDLVTGTPTGRQCKWNSGNSHLEFDSTLPFASGETVFVIFTE